MSAEYLRPKLNETFDQLAAEFMRDILLNSYENAPEEIKSMLENIAVHQSLKMMGKI